MADLGLLAQFAELHGLFPELLIMASLGGLHVRWGSLLVEHGGFASQNKPVESALDDTVDTEAPDTRRFHLDIDVVAARGVARGLLCKDKTRLLLPQDLADSPVMRMAAEGPVHFANDSNQLPVRIIVDLHLLKNRLTESNDKLLEREIRLAKDSNLEDLLLHCL